MLLIAPIASSLARMVRAGTPMASENVADGAGQVDDDLALARRGGVGAGAADVRAAGGRDGRGGRLLPRRRRAPAPADRFRLSCRCSRPPRCGGPSSSFSARRAAAAARGRSRPEGQSPGGKAARLRRARRPASRRAASWRPPRPWPSSPRACGVLGKRLAAGPAGADRVRRELDVGFLRGRLLGFWLRRRLDRGGGSGASLIAGAACLLLRRLWRRAPSSAGFFFGGGRLLRLRGSTGHLAGDRAARGNVVFAAEGLGSPAAIGVPGRPPARPGPRPSARAPRPPAHVRLQRGQSLRPSGWPAQSPSP